MNKQRQLLNPIVIIGLLFFIFGFVTWLNASLIPFLKIACELTVVEAYLVTFAFYISYFVMSIPSSFILEKVGYKRGMAFGLLSMAFGSLLFIPAAITREYTLFLVGLFIQGLGLSLLQTASNPYVTIVGPVESAAKRMSIMGIANKAAGILSPLILGAIILSNTDVLIDSLPNLSIADREAELQLLANRVIVPYIIMAVVLTLLAFGINKSGLPDISDNEEEESEGAGAKLLGALKKPYLVLGFFAIFFYVGAEVIAVDTMNLYGEHLGFDSGQRQFFSSFTLGAMLVGYFFGIFTIPRFFSQEKVLRAFAILGVILTILTVTTGGLTSILMLAALGFANSLMWPAIWPLAIEGAGKYTKIGSALLIMGVSGGAVMPLIYGQMSESIDSGLAYLILIPCYLFILYFAISGHKVGKQKTV